MNIIDDIKYRFKNDNAVNRIILINVGVFIFVSLVNAVLFLMNENNSFFPVIIKYLMLPASSYNFILQPWSIITYMFLHDGFMHILFNMLWLFWIGNILHEYLGNKRVYATYFGGGVFGGLLYIICYNLFPAFSSSLHSSYAIGASAGVLAVVVATASLLPEYPIQLFLFGLVRLKWLALATVLLDLISIPTSNAGGHIAHIGGAIFGYFYIKYIYGKLNLPDWLTSIFITKQKLKVHYSPKEKRQNLNTEITQEDVDVILDKISKSGYESLNKKEKEILFKASKD